jgi:2-haloacid dehalogenase
MNTPRLITFDIFGTVLDWRTGLEMSCADAGRILADGEFDRIVDRQSEIEADEFVTYAEITQRSLVDVLGMDVEVATDIGENVGNWPLYPDAGAIGEIMTISPCAALTNSDNSHGIQVQRNLGFMLTDWFTAEASRVYKPNPAFWQQMAERHGLALGPDWWHVSAYADFDLAVANGLGLTTVFVPRPHCRPGHSTKTVRDLNELAEQLRRLE